MEGQRFFDLRRWNTAAAVLNEYVTEEKTRRAHLLAAETFAAKHALFPIPAIQLELSKVGGQCTLQQNQGWGSC